MSRVRCVGPKSLLRQVVDLLHAEGVVHIESAPALGGASALARLAADDAIEREHVDLDRLRAQVTRCLLLLPERPDAERAGAAHPSGDAVTESDLARLAAVTRRLDQLTRRRKLVEDELALLSRYGRVMEALAPLVRRLPVSRDLASIGITMERADPETLGRVREALGRLTADRFELLVAEVDATLTAGCWSYLRRLGRGSGPSGMRVSARCRCPRRSPTNRGAGRSPSSSTGGCDSPPRSPASTRPFSH
jgi:vacuolar-type H+-ATPase subunit I/STV1